MLRNVLNTWTDDHDLRTAVRVALLKALFASRASLIVGAGLGITMASVVAWYCPSPWLIACGALLSLTGILRVVSFGLFKPGHADRHAWKWEIVYQAGAMAFALLVGLETLLTILISDDLHLHLLTAFMSTGYAAGAAGRNTGRPVLALLQLHACALPLSIALLISPSLPGLIVAIGNLLYIAVIADITLRTYRTVLDAYIDRQEKLRLAKVYEKLSKTDPLTGIDNRTTLKDNLDHLLNESQHRVAVLWLDLDRFKQINDTLGHGSGDVVLHTVAARLKSILGGKGTIARFGGDEFVLVLPVSHGEEAVTIAESVIKAINAPIDLGHMQVDVSASVGISLSDGGIDADELLRHADVALYEAKAAGRRCVKLFDPEMERRLLQSKQIERDLKHALENDEMEVYFQPVVCLEAFRVKSFEALLRWRHPEAGNVPPSVFIPIAEASHSIEPITEWVLKQACLQAANWPEDIAVAVNISAVCLSDRTLPSMVANTLLTTRIPPRLLHLEITETALLADDPDIKFVLEALKGIGVSLSLDDFGTGYSSLSHLCRYRFDTIKIDRSFLANIQSQPESRAVIQAIVGLATSLDLTVVAEGIETLEQLNYVAEHGCGAGQGYYFAKPMPAAEVPDYLSRAEEEITRYAQLTGNSEDRVDGPDPGQQKVA
ncbi:MAG TPA: EAL domain-containing protein [Sphingobium sp.]|uniref:putative bifunctional diguanylate cyclase/phosphodiesterase n=1 Tax=Sphingobium sp. TaxID=1912891 RepID=UPI002ED40438